MSAPERPIAADWLALRRDIDARARLAADPLLTRLAAHLRAQSADPEPVMMVDVGAGTGANRAYLQPRLPFATRWTLLDHDADLLADPGHDSEPGPAQVRRVLAGVEQLAQVVAELHGRSRVVTCSALLDLLTVAQLDALLAALLETATPALLALTVTGEVTLDPADPLDTRVRAAFDAHQERAGLLGPRAAAYLAARARSSGAHVVEAATPWVVTAERAAGRAVDGSAGRSAERAFVARFLTDRADAAVEQLRGSGDDAGPALVEGWLARRLDDLTAGRLRLTVGHVDLLILPPA